MKVACRLFAFFLLVLAAGSAHAHKPSDSYLKLDAGGEVLSLTWDLALKDLEVLVGLDLDQNGEITWGELKSQRSAVEAHALSRLKLTADGTPCALRVDELMVTQHSDGAYAVLVIGTDAPGDVTSVDIEYSLLFDTDPTHRGLVVYRHGEETSTHILTPESPSVELRAGETSLWHTFVEYVREGVWHIWIGFDHILFLLTLLFPAVFLRREMKWEPVETFRPACAAVLKIVTVFTVAHSITLWLAVMEYVSLPGRWVESAIAASIIVTAVANLLPVVVLPGWVIALGFGLIHGFGFANVLQDLGLADAALAVSLLAFNVGVELGQIAIVLAFMPVAFLLRRTALYRWGVLWAGSVLIALLAAVWLCERALDLEIIGI